MIYSRVIYSAHSGDEPGCAVQSAVESGELSIERLRSYQKLKNENRYVEDAEGYLAEKNRKFKAIAKINKRNHKHLISGCIPKSEFRISH